MSRLEKEPRLLAAEEARLGGEIETLAVSHYRAFIASADCVRDAFTSVDQMDSDLQVLGEQVVPKFARHAESFLNEARALSAQQRRNRVMLEQQVQLLALLEIPQLMETCSHELYEEALDLEEYARSLSARQGHRIPILNDLVQEMAGTLDGIRTRLLQALQGDVQLAELFSIIGHLRRMEVFSEQKLREQFLHSREVWLETKLAAISVSPEEHPYEYLLKFLHAMRAPLFEVITQYRAIFVDDSSSADSSVQSSDNGLLFVWVSQRVDEIYSTLERLLGSIEQGSLLANVLEQAMYSGFSLARVGVDFRGLLPRLFHERVLALFRRNLERAPDEFAYSLTQFDWLVPSERLASLGVNLVDPILQFPPLVALNNVFAEALKQLRQCAPLSTKSEVIEVVENTLMKCVLKLRSMGSLSYGKGDEGDAPESASEPVEELAEAMVKFTIPSIRQSLESIYAKHDGGRAFEVGKLHRVLETIGEGTLVALAEEEVAEPESVFSIDDAQDT